MYKISVKRGGPVNKMFLGKCVQAGYFCASMRKILHSLFKADSILFYIAAYKWSCGYIKIVWYGVHLANILHVDYYFYFQRSSIPSSILIQMNEFRRY